MSKNLIEKPSDNSVFRLIKMVNCTFQRRIWDTVQITDLKQAGLSAQNNRHMCSQNEGLLFTVYVLMCTHIESSNINSVKVEPMKEMLTFMSDLSVQTETTTF